MHFHTNHELSIPKIKNVKKEFEPNSASGFNLSYKEIMSESVDRQQTMVDKVTIITIWVVLKSLRQHTKF